METIVKINKKKAIYNWAGRVRKLKEKNLIQLVKLIKCELWLKIFHKRLIIRVWLNGTGCHLQKCRRASYHTSAAIYFRQHPKIWLEHPPKLPRAYYALMLHCYTSLSVGKIYFFCLYLIFNFDFNFFKIYLQI